MERSQRINLKAKISITRLITKRVWNHPKYSATIDFSKEGKRWNETKQAN